MTVYCSKCGRHIYTEALGCLACELSVMQPSKTLPPLDSLQPLTDPPSGSDEPLSADNPDVKSMRPPAGTSKIFLMLLAIFALLTTLVFVGADVLMKKMPELSSVRGQMVHRMDVVSPTSLGQLK